MKNRLICCSFALVVLAAAILCSRSVENYRSFFGMYHDDGIYLVTAKALAENLGYRIISLPGDPPQTKYPVGYPAYLSVLWRLFPSFPDNLTPLCVLQVVLALGAGLAAAAYLFRTRKVTPLLALVITSASLLNTHYVDFAPMLMSDLPYALLSFLALWAIEKISTGRTAAAAGILIALVCTVRSQGIALLASALIYLSIRRKFRLALTMLAAATLVLAPQFLWQRVAQMPVPGYLTFYTSYFAHAYQTLPEFSSLWPVIWSNLFWSGVLQINTYYPLLSGVPYQLLSPPEFELIYRIGYPLLGLPLIIGGLREIRRGSLLGLYCFAYALLLSFWPVRLEWRHIFPLLPLNYYLLIRGYRVLARWLKPRQVVLRLPYSLVCRYAAICFSSFIVAGTAMVALQTGGCYGVRMAQPVSQAELAKFKSDYEEAYDWIRANTKQTDTFVCNNDPTLYLYTGRKAVLPSPMEMWRFIRLHLVDSDSLIEAIRFAHAEYVLTEPTFRGTGLAMAQTNEAIEVLSKRFPGALKLVHSSANGLVRIFAVEACSLKFVSTEGQR